MWCAVPAQVEQDYEKKPEEVDLRSAAYIKSAAERMPDIGRKASAHLINPLHVHARYGPQGNSQPGRTPVCTSPPRWWVSFWPW